ncbi:hypothetical protein B0O99DRAFT_629357, partial [Bisporella sp. PMI_857]
TKDSSLPSSKEFWLLFISFAFRLLRILYLQSHQAFGFSISEGTVAAKAHDSLGHMPSLWLQACSYCSCKPVAGHVVTPFAAQKILQLKTLIFPVGSFILYPGS